MLIGASYAGNLSIPHNVYGLRGFLDLLELSRRRVGLLPFWRSQPIRALHDPVKLEGPDWKKVWREEVARLQEAGDFREPTVIVYLALHGGSGREGAYLLADAEGANRLPVADVLAALAKLPREKKKLLILDATQVTDDWSLGMLHNDFARELKELPGGDQGGREPVGPRGQRRGPAVVDRRRRPPVGLLAGRRRGPPRGGRRRAEDGRVNLRELYDYVGPRVKAWVVENRGDVQTPLLLPPTTTGRWPSRPRCR